MHLSLIFLALTLLVLSACYDSDVTPPPEELESADAYVEAVVEIELQRVQRCCDEAGARGVVDGYEVGYLSWPASDSGVPFDGHAAAACLRDLAQLELPCWQLKVPFPSYQGTACHLVYGRGDRQLGDPCEEPWDCALDERGDTLCGARWVSASRVFEDVCQLYRIAQEGEVCMDDDPETTIDCEWPLLCDEENGRCVTRAARGERCLTGSQWGDTCELGSVCDSDGTERCVEPISEGERCGDQSTDFSCEGGNCQDGVCRAPVDDPFACEW
jgi:hypothetical protein